jgi:hypothetical protein
MLNKIIAFSLVALIPVGVIFLSRRRKEIINKYVRKNNGRLLDVTNVKKDLPLKNLTETRVFKIRYKQSDGKIKEIYGDYKPLSSEGFKFYENLEDVPFFLDTIF